MKIIFLLEKRDPEQHNEWWCSDEISAEEMTFIKKTGQTWRSLD